MKLKPWRLFIPERNEELRKQQDFTIPGENIYKYKNQQKSHEVEGGRN